MHRGLRRTAIEIDVKANGAVRQQIGVAQREMMLRRADRPAMEWRHYGAAIIAVGSDIEYEYEAEYREGQIAKGDVLERQRQASGHPAKPRLCCQRWIAPEQNVVDRVGAAA